MNHHLWEFNERGAVCIGNDANGYYYEWAELHAADKTLIDLFDEYFGAKFKDVNVRVKAREGAIFIVAEGDKDDTEI